jgi:hypothetical protein
MVQMRFPSVLLLLAASVIDASSPKCTQVSVSLAATASVQKFTLTGPNYDALVASNFATGAADLSSGVQTASGSHLLQGTYCEPSSGVKSSTLQSESSSFHTKTVAEYNNSAGTRSDVRSRLLGLAANSSKLQLGTLYDFQRVCNICI